MANGVTRMIMAEDVKESEEKLAEKLTKGSNERAANILKKKASLRSVKNPHK